ncbi:amidohydrolase, imidazolonepropionase [Desulfitobacterium dichloroeliminans LMG P-21439]|uniref:Amidohydrolase, imidazolonepropionase n=1 Tax=Desulfitobacterium dichloroeliminans (strain LMG P-21439 / DCA1) TaxID=871963 RepID=L0F8F2_DESDL|nr:amidohydrolase, imidazolonepropionase [Desulfitobacterium dichloroeliminans LMG P-21439]
MPGFIDTHVHLALDSIDFFQCLENWQDSAQIEKGIQDVLRHYLELGIVAIRDGGDLPGFAWAAKQRLENQEWLGPKVVSVREAVTRHGMYGRFLGRGFQNVQDWQQLKEEFFRQGADQLKVVVTGIVSFSHYGQVGPAQWSIKELGNLVDSAHKRGILVMAHASGEEGISRAIAAGVDSIEHGYYMTSAHLKKVKEGEIAWVPTVAPIGNLLKYPSGRYSRSEMDNLRRILNDHLKRVKEAYDMGIRLGMGTDAGAYAVPHGGSFLDEMSWMEDAGIPTNDIYRLATQENARICGLPEYGKLEVGTPLSCLQLQIPKRLGI